MLRFTPLDFESSREANRRDSCEYVLLELRRHAVDSIHILEVIVFRIPFNFAVPSRNRKISNFSHTEHRVGEDVDLVWVIR